ncbi:MAG: AAA family ATPase [Methylovulum miyakonense]|uniref:AAA family ATPase n=1 Tax=Methylovulum miyakonense TaxID=645578 RepID=UPI003BB6002E
MAGYIQKIKTKIPFSSREVEIDLQGKNLILTGGNGCGKTQLLNHLDHDLQLRIVKKQNPDLQEVKDGIEYWRSKRNTKNKASSEYDFYNKNLNDSIKELEEARNSPFTIDQLEQFVIRYDENKALCIKFEANRQANITCPQAASSKESLKQKDTKNKNSTVELFEEYLVSHKTAQAYAESSIDNNPTEARNIKEWFDKLETDLRELFEDQTLELKFDSGKQAFFIKQDKKDLYRFQQLSSGFSSILSIYADLLTKVELRSISPEEIDGVVLIDEIDAHLHVSLQRKIFAFLDKSFPKVQFIVTTHSPFVVSSVNDAVIYDLSRLEQVDDLSMYSYESVLEGLFNVLPISEILKNKITEMSQIAVSDSPDVTKLEALVIDVSQHESKLDEESAYFLKSAKLVVSKAKNKGN